MVEKNYKDLLISRRSIRKFNDKKVPNELLMKVFDNCRYAPTSKNSQSFYFLIIRDREILSYLADLRGRSSKPISEASLAVAICTDNEKTKRPLQDGCIAAYHFLLAAHLYGLGTCWIADLDRDEVKQRLNIPLEHYIATITPVGYSVKKPVAPFRKSVEEFVNF